MLSVAATNIKACWLQQKINKSNRIRRRRQVVSLPRKWTLAVRRNISAHPIASRLNALRADEEGRSSASRPEPFLSSSSSSSDCMSGTDLFTCCHGSEEETHGL